MSSGDPHKPSPSADADRELKAPYEEAEAAEVEPGAAAEGAPQADSDSQDDGPDVASEEAAASNPGASNPGGDQQADSSSDDSVNDDGANASEGEPDEEESAPMDWYILKVQSNRENSICDGLRRRIAIAGLDQYFGEVLVPTEDVAEYKNGKRRIVKRKLYPGYIVVHMAINEDTWFVVRETPGIGDFTGAAGKPTPMLPHEVERIVKSARPDDESEEPIKTAIPFKVADRVRIKEGTFENFEGDVEGIDEANGRVTVMINIFGRSTPVELEHWQIEAV